MPKPVYSKQKRLAKLFERELQLDVGVVDENPAAHWTGNPDAKFAIVTSYYETYSEENKVILLALSRIGLKPDDVYITTATKRFLVKHMQGHAVIDTRSVTKKEIDALRPFLLEELDIVSPSVVLCLGTNPAKVLIGDPGFTVSRNRGLATFIQGLPFEIHTTNSPGYITRKGNPASLYMAFENEIRMAWDSVNSEE